MVAQDRDVGDRLATVYQHHGQVERDPAWVVATAALAKVRQRVAELPAQARRVRDVREQSSADMAGDTPTTRADNDPRT